MYVPPSQPHIYKSAVTDDDLYRCLVRFHRVLRSCDYLLTWTYSSSHSIEIGEPLFDTRAYRFTCDWSRILALYGKSYIPAAKDTWRLLKDRGIDALVNDSLVGTGKWNPSPLLRGTYQLTYLAESSHVGRLHQRFPMRCTGLLLPQM